jgi:DNA-binding GntR family transcriptional regulator
MNAGPTAERIYIALKRLIFERRFRPGEKLDPGRLADELGSSVTPVRDALHVLAGEGLIETRISEGYALPLIDEPGLKDLYRWCSGVLQLAVRAAPRPHQLVAMSVAAERDDERAAALFAAMAKLTDNAECIRTVNALIDRTAALRHAEHAVLDGVAAELDEIEAALGSGDPSLLARQIGGYYRRRERHAGAVLRALYRAP